MTSVKENGTLKLRYTYDNLGQLTREDNAYAGKTYVYTYDNGGNILTKKTYACTTGTVGTVQSTVNYGYDNSNWKDQLTSYNGSAITYDASGNPLNWRNASAMNWTGRQLDSMTLTNGTNVSFQYNSDGLRVSKTVGSNTVKYRWDGTTLLAEEHSNYTLTFLYDGDTLIGFNYGGNNYFYGIDNLGVIHYVYNEAGTVVVTYTYDAWGNTVSASGNSTLISVNPIRYKSYYYDNETGLYYLVSRYYDPGVCRFVNPDGVMGVNDDVSTYNLYVYCGNSPANRCDDYGFLWKELWGGIKKAAKKVAQKAEKVIEPVLHKANDVAVAVGIDTAALGAFFLNMKKYKNGVYHANFLCWQSIFGYNAFYDEMFEIGTDMNADQFSFDYNKKTYVFWAWKGDYINLGAGAELGIYLNAGVHNLVIFTRAMPMTLKLEYRGKTIISYGATTWWITGFNPKYLNVKARDLTATYTVDFSMNKTNRAMYQKFFNKFRYNDHWTFDTKNYKATYSFDYSN